MHVISSFEHSIYLELAITALEELGVQKERIYAVPLRQRTRKPAMFDSIHHSDGISLFDGGVALATALTVVGSSYGFILKGGPILWGIIGAITGFFIGYLIDFIWKKKRRRKSVRGTRTEVVVLVSCAREEVRQIEAILWEHFAFGVAVCE
ncbi:hypothetical protein [Paenibacillus sp. N3.4]|uniref:hypothetical protein n=1 Tax=Paenibacillus sp. N3.4 TaxID=2603222 RepID=UPI0011C8B858|nr:hypothetical protein [Paenibacillus sp. N3.4]TXK76097.1 hypothetical protein FU659_26235 [Paenibacillus sp. N3.4]